MSCEVSIPIDSITTEVVKSLALDSYVKADEGVVSNITIKGGITLAPEVVSSLCQQLRGCLTGTKVANVALNGDALTLTLTDGEKFVVDLSKYATDTDLGSLELRLTKLNSDLLSVLDTKGEELTARIADLDKSLAVLKEKVKACCDCCCSCDDDGTDGAGSTNMQGSNNPVADFTVNETAGTLNIKLSNGTTLTITGAQLLKILPIGEYS